MKAYITFLLLAASLSAGAQWSNTTNQFYDSLHMPVSRATADQSNPLVIQSYPDGGWFVIWQDNRNYNTSKTDIYAQKYDKNGNRLWAENGMPVTTGPNSQYYVFSSNEDYRSRPFAATDSTGGFYMCYIDDSVNNYSWPRIAVQHVKSDGSAVFGGAGFIVAGIPSTESYSFAAPELIADGAKGFYIAYIKNPYAERLYVLNGKDENGVMRIYSNNVINQNAVQKYNVVPCAGNHPYIEYPVANVGDYQIWPDGQRGCNVVMSLAANGTQGTMLGYNRIWRAKKSSRVRTLHRNETGVSCPQTEDFKKDSTYLMYRLQGYFTETFCTGNPAYVVTNYFLISNGFLLIDNGAYDYNYPKGTMVTTDTNINVNMLAVTKRKISGSSISDFTVQGFAMKVEVFDSIPYQLTSNDNVDLGYNYLEPGLNKLGSFRDTLLASGNYYPDFSLAGGGQDIFAAGLMSTFGGRNLRLQHLKIKRAAPDSLSIEYQADKAGDVISREVSTGFQNTDIFYDFPRLTVTNDGTGIFSISDGRFNRISPVWYRTRLQWGAAGRPAGTGIYNYRYSGNDQDVTAIDPATGTGVIAWHDNRNAAAGLGTDIYMRHVDNLTTIPYDPPRRAVRLVPNPFGPTATLPVVLMGSSKAYTPFEIASIYNEPSNTTVADIADEYNLGYMRMSVYQNTGTIRSYNNQPYLDRNITVVPENTPTGANIGVRFYFTTQEFNALKATDNSLTTPGDLVIVGQPITPNDVPATYAPVAGEKVYATSVWDSLPGGYYVQFSTTGFGNFFIMKSATAAICPGGNTSISSNLTGGSYQWQMDMGAGFFNITNDASHGGTSTATLQLNSIPSTWYGYKFRCVVDGSPGNIFALRFLANWTGTAGTDWNNPANWGCGAVPDANTDVVITSGSVIVNSNSSCRTLTVKPGASITVKPGINLNVMK